MNPTPSEIRTEYLKRAKENFDKAKQKIEDCYNENRNLEINKSQMFENISFCSTNEVDDFRVKWLRSFPDTLTDDAEIIHCLKETHRMYIELIEFPQRLLSF